MTRVVQGLVKGLMFKFSDFSLSEHSLLRIVGVFRQCTVKGMIAQGLDRNRNPAVAVVVRRVLKVLYGKSERLNDSLITVLVTALGDTTDKYRKSFLSVCLYTCSQLAT
jgi:hypothetical protein